MMKFKLDENIPIKLKSVITEAGYEACDVYEQHLSGSADNILFERCKKENYIFITCDADFEHVWLSHPDEYPGIVVLKLKSQGISAVTSAVTRIFRTIDVSQIKNNLIIVSSSVIKLRKRQ